MKCVIITAIIVERVTTMWFDESVFYQIYPLGFCGAEKENDYGETRHRLYLIEQEIPRLQELGVTAVLLNPIFESERHGYDTVDFFKIDRRLGTNEEFAALVAAFHKAGIRVVLDGVFNHVGRAFPPFVEVLKQRENTDYRFWFQIDFHGNSCYNDGLNYENWEGHAELVRLRLENQDLQNYLMDAVRFWIREFAIDGLRLDVCYLLPPWFMELLRRTVNAEKSDFYLMGEVIHCGNFQGNISPTRLDSITNYECFKGMISAYNSNNLFEIEHSLTRLFSDQPWSLYTGKRLFSFVDNHDVLRAYTALQEKRNIYNLYTLLFTIPGIPCVYYGSEFGAEGDKSNGDYGLRPYIGDVDKTVHSELVAYIQKLCRIRTSSRALAYGSYRKATLNNKNFSFVRVCDGETILVAINIEDRECVIHADCGEGQDLLSGQTVRLDDIRVPAFGACVIKKN